MLTRQEPTLKRLPDAPTLCIRLVLETSAHLNLEETYTNPNKG